MPDWTDRAAVAAFVADGAELTILPDAGQYPMFEAPVSLATSIEDFLERA